MELLLPSPEKSIEIARRRQVLIGVGPLNGLNGVLQGRDRPTEVVCVVRPLGVVGRGFVARKAPLAERLGNCLHGLGVPCLVGRLKGPKRSRRLLPIGRRYHVWMTALARPSIEGLEVVDGRVGQRGSVVPKGLVGSLGVVVGIAVLCAPHVPLRSAAQALHLQPQHLLFQRSNLFLVLPLDSVKLTLQLCLLALALSKSVAKFGPLAIHVVVGQLSVVVLPSQLRYNQRPDTSV